MNLAFFTKIFYRWRNQAQVLLKLSCTLGKLVNTQIKGITLICTGNNNICISCVFNGFKYRKLTALVNAMTVNKLIQW